MVEGDVEDIIFRSWCPTGLAPTLNGMITCVVHCVIDPDEIDDVERFASRWIDLVQGGGGDHHGYFLPGEGASDATLRTWRVTCAGGA